MARIGGAAPRGMTCPTTSCRCEAALPTPSVEQRHSLLVQAGCTAHAAAPAAAGEPANCVCSPGVQPLLLLDRHRRLTQRLMLVPRSCCSAASFHQSLAALPSWLRGRAV